MRTTGEFDQGGTGYDSPMPPWISLSLFLAVGGLFDPSMLPTPDETRSELDAVCQRLARGENPYFGNALAQRLEAKIQAMNPGGDAELAVGFRGRLAEEYLRLGKLEEARARLLEALQLTETHELPPGLRNRLVYLLGLGELRLAEQQNCVAHHGGESCILPLAEGGIHRDPGAARRAMGYFEKALAQDPQEIQARWLLNLASLVAGSGLEAIAPERRISPSAAARLTDPSEGVRWPNLAAELGVDAVDLAGGSVIEDFDGDGWLDLVTSTWDPCGTLKAFRNDGQGGFQDVTESWGLHGQLGGLNLSHADFDNDGRKDLLVLRGAWLGDDGKIRSSLLRNDLGPEGGSFQDVTTAAGLAYPAYPTQTGSWADYDGDGDLDLFVGNEASSSQVFSWQMAEDPGRPFPSQLFQNQGNGVFVDKAREAGVANLRFAKGVAWGDYDNDGDPDLYVSNLGLNRLYRNEGADVQGKVRFVDVAPRLGVTGPEKASFATWFFDVDNDGDLDLFVADYSARVRKVSAWYVGLEPESEGHLVLYRNSGGTFTDVSLEVGFDRPLLPMGANFGDLDNDGWLDVFLGTGVPDLEAVMPDAVFRNVAGQRFREMTFAAGLGHLQKGHGVSFGDLDHDGDLDVLHQMGGAFPSDSFANALYENPGNENSWVAFELEGRLANRSGLGARIEVRIADESGGRSIHRVVGTGGSFGSSSLRQVVGLGRAREIERVEILWPGSGTRQTLGRLAPERLYRIIEGEDQPKPLELSPVRLGGRKQEQER